MVPPLLYNTCLVLCKVCLVLCNTCFVFCNTWANTFKRPKAVQHEKEWSTNSGWQQLVTCSLSLPPLALPHCCSQSLSTLSLIEKFLSARPIPHSKLSENGTIEYTSAKWKKDVNYFREFVHWKRCRHQRTGLYIVRRPFFIAAYTLSIGQYMPLNVWLLPALSISCGDYFLHWVFCVDYFLFWVLLVLITLL